jgi:hypothetical protein
MAAFGIAVAGPPSPGFDDMEAEEAEYEAARQADMQIDFAQAEAGGGAAVEAVPDGEVMEEDDGEEQEEFEAVPSSPSASSVASDPPVAVRPAGRRVASDSGSEYSEEDEESVAGIQPSHSPRSSEAEYQAGLEQPSPAGSQRSSYSSNSGGPASLQPWMQPQANQNRGLNGRRRVTDSDDEDDGPMAGGNRRPQMAGGAPPARGSGLSVDADTQSDFNESHLRFPDAPHLPQFKQGTNRSASAWQSASEVGQAGSSFRPVRVLSWCIPVALFPHGGTHFRHWCTPHNGRARGAQIAALLGLAFTGTSKGFL